MTEPSVIAVHKKSSYSFHKDTVPTIYLVAGIGVEGDIHSGETVKHRSRVRRDPAQPNLRQVHLMPSELFDELKEKGFKVRVGELGENITTSGIDLINLPKDTRMIFESGAEIQITGLRNPCHQLDDWQKGLLKACLEKDAEGNLIRKAGVMAIVLKGGKVSAKETVRILKPSPPHISLEKV